MGNQAQLDKARELVKTSTHLSAAERTEWLDLLPFMNDKQVVELLAVLASPVVSRPTAALPAGPEEKDLPAPARPLLGSATNIGRERGEPAPKSSASPVAAPAANQKLVPKSHGTLVTGEGANTVSAFLDRNFATTLHRQPESKSSSSPIAKPATKETGAPSVRPLSDIAPKQSPLSPAPPQQRPASPPVAQSSVPAGSGVVSQSVTPDEGAALITEEVVNSLKSLEDVRRLNVATLRGRGALTIEGELKALCTKFGYFSVQFALEHAPLYQTYLAVGSRVLKNHEPFENVQAELSTAGRPYLTKPEFEEVNDLLQRIKSA
jgi:hypothetical protein